MLVNFSSTEYRAFEGDGVVNINVSFGEIQTQMVVGLITVPGSATGQLQDITTSSQTTIMSKMFFSVYRWIRFHSHTDYVDRLFQQFRNSDDPIAR